MNHKLAMAIIGEIQTLSALLLLPDARWEAVQDWLKRNPRWRKEVNHYLRVSPAEAVEDLKEYLIEETEIPQVIAALAITPQVEAQARAAIEKLQTLYRERQAEIKRSEKEIENVRTRRQAERRSTKNHRRTDARTKRTDQT